MNYRCVNKNNFWEQHFSNIFAITYIRKGSIKCLGLPLVLIHNVDSILPFDSWFRSNLVNVFVYHSVHH